jgi:hypothetical protein
MDVPEEMRMIYIFIREATLTKYYHTPNYDRFKYLVNNIYHFVGLERTLANIKEKAYEQVICDFIKKKCISEVAKAKEVKR